MHIVIHSNGEIHIVIHSNGCIRDQAVARVVDAAGGAAASRGFELSSTHDPHRGFFSIFNRCSLSRVELQRDCGAPVAYGALDSFGNLLKDVILESRCSCRVCLCTCSVCECECSVWC